VTVPSGPRLPDLHQEEKKEKNKEDLGNEQTQMKEGGRKRHAGLGAIKLPLVPCPRTKRKAVKRLECESV